MFTGIVEAVGRVADRREELGILRLAIESSELSSPLVTGASVAVSGVCLTVTRHAPKRFEADVAGETVRRSTLGGLSVGSRVNLELPLRADGRLDGHFVQGHVDCRGEVKSSSRRASDRVLRIGHPTVSDPLVVEKGSIAVDGVSLTVTGCDAGWFEVMLIPHTLSVTTLGDLGAGAEVNLEYDILAKYLVRLTRLGQSEGRKP